MPQGGTLCVTVASKRLPDPLHAGLSQQCLPASSENGVKMVFLSLFCS